MPGSVGIDQSIPGTTNKVVADITLGAGTAVLGKVSIDQTTPGTTNHVDADVTRVGGVAVALGQALAAASLPVVLTAAQLASLMAPVLAAGTALIGRIVTSPDVSNAYDGTTALTPKFAAVAASSSGDNTIVAAVTSKKIRVLSYTLMANAAVNAKWQSSVAGDKSGLLYLAANGGVSSGFCPLGHFETVAGEALELNLSGAVAVGGHITYVEV